MINTAIQVSNPGKRDHMLAKEGLGVHNFPRHERDLFWFIFQGRDMLEL